VPRKQAPVAIGRAYTAALVSHACAPARAAFAEVEPEILRLMEDLRREQGRTDAVPPEKLPELAIAAASSGEPHKPPREGMPSFAAAEWRGRKAAELIDKAARQFKKKLRPDALHAVVKQFGNRTDEHARKQLDQQLRSAIGVPLSSIERPMQDKLGEWTAVNVSLIVTVPERYFDRLQEDVQEAFAGGTHPRTLAKQFEDRYDMSENDADRIARDQTLKLSADLNHARMESIGVERAIWRTMKDGRVSDDCADLEGVEFNLADGVDGLFPGINNHPMCRCYSEPVLDDILG
jgi:SPP1 gp7 family putative phage head morphogenesis protein